MATRVLLIHFTPPGVIGGVEHILQQHIQLLTDRGYRFQMLAGQAGDPSVHTHVMPEIDVANPDNGAVEDELGEGVVGPRFYQKLRTIEAKLSSLCADAHYVIVHNAMTLHFSLPLTAALWRVAARRTPRSVIAWCHDLSWVNPLYIPLMHEGYPWDLLRVPAPNVTYVTVSDERKRELEGLWDGYHDQIRVVPNGIDVPRFLRLSPPTCAILERYRLLDRDLVLLLPVRITRRKNIQLGVRVVAELKRRGLDVRFLVSGPVAPHHPGRSDAYLTELKQEREAADVVDEVVFLADDLGANLDTQTVSELYSLADALLFPSASEGFGLPLLEAGLAHVPAIASGIPIFREVAENDFWRFDLEEAPSRIADSVLEAVGSRPGKLFRRVLRQYRWDVVIDRHVVPLLSQ